MESRRTAHQQIRRQLLVGVVTAILLVFGVGGWALTTELSGAVFAPAQLVVDSNVKKVQHPTGGIVEQLRVRDGNRVRAGEIVIRLDETVTRSNLAVIDKAMVELAARQARDEAERDGAASIAFPSDLLARMSDPETASVVRGEERLFAIRRTARDGLKAQLGERIGQLREEIRGLTEQVKAKDAEVQLIGQELKGVRELWQKNIVPLTRLVALEREAARLGGERGSLTASIAQAKGRISETELQILQIDQDLRAEVGKDLAEIRARTAELVEKRIAAEDQLKRIDIRSPQDGVVHQLAVHTVGGVIPAGEVLMLIVPEGDALIVEARISPQEIDRIWVGQTAVLRFTAFNQRTTPEISGEVTRIAADVSQDPKTGSFFYTVRLSLPDREIARLEGLKLIPGMPVEAFVQTGDRTVVSYLTKPLHDQIMKAWRER